MKPLLKLLAVILISAAALSATAGLLAQQPVPKPAEHPKVQIVYVTRTGKRYHRLGCRHLTKTATPMPLSDAKKQCFTACKVCKPEP